MNPLLQLRPGDALIIVDVQNDFLPGGALAVPDGGAVVSELNRCIELFERRKLPVYATRDWHPLNHMSFQAQGGPWPAHCVMNTPGADFAPGLKLSPGAKIISKASAPTEEAYSGFQGTGLERQLRTDGVERVFVGGLATDYCVLNTVKDARQAGFEVMLLTDATRAVNVAPEDGRRAGEEMFRLGAKPIKVAELAA